MKEETKKSDTVNSVDYFQDELIAGGAVYTMSDKLNLTIRLVIRMTDEVKAKALEQAVRSVEKRFPYLMMQYACDGKDVIPQKNEKPFVLINTDEPVPLSVKESNNHLLAFSYKDDYIYVDAFHAVLDGTAIFYVAKTLLYYYLLAVYGKPLQVPDLAMVGDVIEPDEYRDPYLLYDERQKAGPDKKSDAAAAAKKTEKGKANKKGVLRLDKDGLMKTDRQRSFRLHLSQSDLMRFVKDTNESPATAIPLFLSRAIHELHPQNEKDILILVPMNLRPVFGIKHTHHTFTTQLHLTFGEKMWTMTPDLQGASLRSMIKRQSDPDEVLKNCSGIVKFNQLVNKIPFVLIKHKLMRRIADMTMTKVTSSVSYTGRCNFGDMEQYIREFYLDADGYGTGIEIELTSVNDDLFISWSQDYWEKDYFDAFLRQLTEFEIDHKVIYDGPFKISKMKAPWTKRRS